MICYVPLVHDLAPTVKNRPDLLLNMFPRSYPLGRRAQLVWTPDAALSPFVEQASLAAAVFVAVAEGHLM